MIFFNIKKIIQIVKLIFWHFHQIFILFYILKHILTWDIKKIITIKFNNWVVRSKCENWLLLHLWKPASLRTDWLRIFFTQPGSHQVKRNETEWFSQKMWEMPNTGFIPASAHSSKMLAKILRWSKLAYFEFSSSNSNVQGHILSTARFKAFK
jgi:hypothetical protein